MNFKNSTVNKNMEKDSVNDYKKIIREKDEIISNLEETNKSLLSLVNKYNGMKNALKSSLPFDIEEGEKLMCLIIVSADSRIHFSIICKNTLKFFEVENLLYENFPVYKEKNNVFLFNGVIINRSKTLTENGIEDGQIIIMVINED